MTNPDLIIRDLEVMSHATNYKDWIRSRFSDYVGRRIMEVGAGIGTFTELFMDREELLAIDSYEPCVRYMKKRFANHSNVMALEMDISSAGFLDLNKHRPDTIICLNVLEHVKDDEQAMSDMFRILAPGGRLLLLVPAFQFLYGSIDRLVGHHRRYRKQELRKKIENAGFNVAKLYYMNSLAVIGWLLTNRVLKQQEESLEQVLLYDKLVVPVLRRVEDIAKPPFGLSLVAVAEKP